MSLLQCAPSCFSGPSCLGALALVRLLLFSSLLFSSLLPLLSLSLLPPPCPLLLFSLSVFFSYHPSCRTFEIHLARIELATFSVWG